MEVGQDFAFASNAFTVFLSFLITLLTVDIRSDRVFAGFVAVEISSGTLGAYFLFRWRRGRKRGSRIIAKIRERQVGPLGTEGKEIRASELAEMDVEEPEKTAQK